MHTHIASFTHFPPLLIHTHTHGQAAIGGGNARNAPNPGLVFWLVPDFMPSPPGSVARPPCARPTGSNTRPGQPSCSSRPIINQQAALQHTSPPPPHTTAGAPWKLRGRIYSLVLQLVYEDAVEDSGGGGIDDVYMCINSIMFQHSQSCAFKHHEFSGCNLAWDVQRIITASKALLAKIKVAKLNDFLKSLRTWSMRKQEYSTFW